MDTIKVRRLERCRVENVVEFKIMASTEEEALEKLKGSKDEYTQDVEIISSNEIELISVSYDNGMTWERYE